MPDLPAFRNWAETDGLHVHWHDAGPDLTAIAVAEAQILAEHAGDDHTRHVFATNASANDTVLVQALIDADYREAFAQVSMEFVVGEADVQHSHEIVASRIESVGVDDLRALWELNNAIYNERDFSAVATEAGAAAFHDEAGDLELWALVRGGGNGPIAFVASAMDDHVGVIRELSVHADHRREALGSTLLRWALTRLAGHGARSVQLVTDRDDRSGARSLYERTGFRVTDSELRFRKPFS